MKIWSQISLLLLIIALFFQDVMTKSSSKKAPAKPVKKPVKQTKPVKGKKSKVVE
jgi:hypothetical protein